MKYYLIAGEASGDLHGSNLMKELKELDPEASFRFWGGDLMAAQGGEPVKHIRELAFMGFKEVLLNLRTILKNIRHCKEDIANWQPDVLVLIDYPGFNLRIAKWAKEQNIRTFYYISPQIWAWKKSRVHSISQNTDRVYVILPFEKDFYAQYGYEVDFTGHPLIDVVEDSLSGKRDREGFLRENNLPDKEIVAIVPGSRKQEISKKLPVMLAASRNFPDQQFIIAGAPAIDDDYYHQFTQAYPNVSYLSGKTYQILAHAKAAMVTSGTATLETALFGVPEVVCYRAGHLSYHIAKRIIDIDYISLVNVIMNREVVRELIQYELTPKKLTEELDKLLNDTEYRQKIKNDYSELRENLGGGGASALAARLMHERLEAT